MRGIDVGIITIKPEEFKAITDRLGNWSTLDGYEHQYVYQSIETRNGLHYNVAVARSSEQGPGPAQSLTTDMIKELNPTWLFLVGIAGGVPTDEFSLGDVLLCTRLYDFSVSCILEDVPPTFALSGGPMHPIATKLLEVLPAYDKRLEDNGWNSNTSLNGNRPTIDFNSPYFNENLYGDTGIQKKVIDSLRQNFSQPRKPKYYLGPTASSGHLIKSTSLIEIWRSCARGIVDVEMELAGVYLAAQKSNTPVIAIRGLSDIVGYRRSSEWTQFACEAAASFAICLINEEFLTIYNPTRSIRPRIHVPKSLLDKMLSIQDASSLSLIYNSPFHPVGEIPPRHLSYISRDSDRHLEKLLNKHSLIWIQGDFQSGKSSLLACIPSFLSVDWKIFRPQIEFFLPIRVDNFDKKLFKELRKVDNNIMDWSSLRDYLTKSKLVFLIDEIGILPSRVAAIFFTKLYILAKQFPNNIRVVMTSFVSVITYIDSIGLMNPKYCNCWESLRLNPFTKDELTELLNLFPLPIMYCLQKNLDIIQEVTLMKPKEVQCLFDDIWVYLRDKSIPIKEIDPEIKSYLEGYREYDGR
jgi:nucleoside phosphorylase